MLRVALDLTPLIGARTGIGVFTAGILDALCDLPDLAVSGYAVTWRYRRELVSQLPPGVRIPAVPMAARPLRAAWRHLDRPAIEWWTGRVDVVHGTNYVVPPARRAGQVVSVQDLTAIRYPELCEPATLRFPELIRRALRRGAMVHVPTAAVGAEVVDLLGAPEERVRVVHLGVDRSPLTRQPAPPPGDGAASGGAPPYILALGTVEPRKDLPSLVAAFDRIAGGRPDLQLLIAGAPGWGEDALTRAVAGATHRDRIRRLGRVGDAERDRLLRDATVLAYPSVYEGFGLPVLEAMAAGVPVVATAAGGVPEVAGDAARLVPVGDVGALADALSLVVDDAAVRSALVEAGRLRVGEFSWARCAAGLRSLYADAASG